MQFNVLASLPILILYSQQGFKTNDFLTQNLLQQVPEQLAAASRWLRTWFITRKSYKKIQPEGPSGCRDKGECELWCGQAEHVKQNGLFSGKDPQLDHNNLQTRDSRFSVKI